MTTKIGRVEIDGTYVGVDAGDEASARQLAAAIDRDAVRANGTAAEKVERGVDWLADMADRFNGPWVIIASWVLAVVASFLAWPTFAAASPKLAMAWLFGLVGVVCVVVVKLFAGRSGKAAANGDKEGAKLWGGVSICGALMIFIFSVAFQTSVGEDVESGATALHDQIEAEDRAIRTAQYDVDAMPGRTLDELAYQIEDVRRARSQPARNSKGADVGLTVAAAVGGLVEPAIPPATEPATYCIGAKERQYYVDRYCEALIDGDRKLRQRAAFEQAAAALNKRRADLDVLRATRTEKGSSAGAVGRVMASDKADGKIVSAVLTALLMLMVESLMWFLTYVSKRYPKG
jgi:hypothetical protein